MIRPNCRMQFTREDIDFILGTLGRSGAGNSGLECLLGDESSRDVVLDDPALYRALLEQRGCVRVSTHFYFYIFVRRVLRQAGIEDRAVADYLAEVLAEYSRAENAACVLPGHAEPLAYYVDMLAAIEGADEHSGFALRAHVGNHTLFMAGVFPEHVRHRVQRRGAPGMSYLESLGRSNYQVASGHRLARRYDLTEIYGILSRQFRSARLALNDLAERLVSLGDPDYPLGRWLGPAGAGSVLG